MWDYCYELASENYWRGDSPGGGDMPATTTKPEEMLAGSLFRSWRSARRRRIAVRLRRCR